MSCQVQSHKCISRSTHTYVWARRWQVGSQIITPHTEWVEVSLQKTENSRLHRCRPTLIRGSELWPRLEYGEKWKDYTNSKRTKQVKITSSKIREKMFSNFIRTRYNAESSSNSIEVFFKCSYWIITGIHTFFFYKKALDLSWYRFRYPWCIRDKYRANPLPISCWWWGACQVRFSAATFGPLWVFKCSCQKLS